MNIGWDVPTYSNGCVFPHTMVGGATEEQSKFYALKRPGLLWTGNEYSPAEKFEKHSELALQ